MANEKPAYLFGSIMLGLFLGVAIGLGSGYGLFLLIEAFTDAERIDKRNRDAYAAKVKDEYEKLMREEERKTRG
jgi:hypothetical protein